jgi:UDP-N-acetylglucosamine acyltransferase
MPRVHPSAVVDRRAELADDVVVGPGAVVGPGVRVGPATEIQAHAVLERDTDVGGGCLIGYGAVLGSAPQDVHYRDEPTRVSVGEATRIREYVTVHRATAPGGATRVGARCFLMAYVHVAHDCVIGDDVVLANAVQLAGHVEIGHHAWIGGQTPVHQFVRVGEYAFVGGGSRVPQDVPPFGSVAGIPLRLHGINAVGLRRAGFSAEVRLALKHAYRRLFNSDLPTSAALDELRRAAPVVPEVERLLAFVEASARGVLVGGAD